MTDDVDIANEEIQNRLAVSIKSVNDTGKCIWCGTLVTDRRRWCNAQCRDEHTSTYKI